MNSVVGARPGSLIPRARPGNDGERAIQQRLGTTERAERFYADELRDHLDAGLRALLSRQRVFFLATADREGACDCSIRSGAPGFLRVPDDRTLLFPVGTGRGVHASVGNITENPRAGLLAIDADGAHGPAGTGMRVNGRARVLLPEQMRLQFPDLMAPDTEAPLWVRLDVEEVFRYAPETPDAPDGLVLRIGPTAPLPAVERPAKVPADSSAGSSARGTTEIDRTPAPARPAHPGPLPVRSPGSHDRVRAAAVSAAGGNVTPPTHRPSWARDPVEPVGAGHGSPGAGVPGARAADDGTYAPGGDDLTVSRAGAVGAARTGEFFGAAREAQNRRARPDTGVGAQDGPSGTVPGAAVSPTSAAWLAEAARLVAEVERRGARYGYPTRTGPADWFGARR
ncbi:pyridoxamine 5'-phosphate oxidase family protein [Streptomyces sp. ST2-7A]|uniref:pyridoxamine 5'-phosphate oxidase family protein n=1 Tax=Streptomyces sp. ST2-7A TaxID=2907214 RepID=UPI001F26C9F3|nr:pyridoxamine 5'-phosphate oxidase family protein [Streptomyces sp. ST2-7A]MCE7081470.1 pyridoxamine 5'-phosphate oxidase family protein [Streptomyces sp. ST2-7A]